MIKLISIVKFISLFVLLLILGGCWDQKETEEQAYVIAIGLDKAEESENLVKVTYLISNPEAGTAAVGGGSSSEPPREIISFEAEDFVTSRNLANTVIAKQITYDILQIIVVSEDFARDDDFVRWIYDATKSMEIRRDSKLLITKEDTLTFLEINQPKLETRPHEYFKMLFARGKETAMLPVSDLNTFFRITEADADLFLGIYGTTEKSEKQHGKEPDQVIAGEFHYEGETNPTEFAGAAVFKEGKMIDVITIEDTRLAFLLNPTMNGVDILASFPDPFDENYHISTRVNKISDIKIKMDLKKEQPEINVTLPVSIDLLSNHSMTEYQLNEQNKEKLKKSFEDTLEKLFKDFVKKTQEEYKTEPFGWSLIARKKFLTIPEWEDFDWMKTYPDMKVNITVNVELGSFGRQGGLPSLEEVRD
ncbi:Ger(x)C family spore germination protein [Paucisalibacillus globulus]|uniref:Ger(x)C family spore germination protein n=1 Tax=Paucisalibacillus globulus TaxID=351095 RepID=UPI00040D0DE7|nr:Ger(x)C family spore germination protein [Paucisalibacillus globulus]